MSEIKQPTPGGKGTYWVPFPVLALASDGNQICLSAGGGGAAAAKEVPNSVHAHRYDEASRQFSTIAALNTGKQLVTGLSYQPACGLYFASVLGDCRVLSLDEEDNSISELSTFTSETEGKEPSQNFALCSSDCSAIVTGGTDGVLKIWKADLGGGDIQPTLGISCKHTTEIQDADFSPDGSLVAACDRDKNCIIWDAKSGAQKQTIKYPNPKNPKDFFSIRAAKFWTNEQGQMLLLIAVHGARGPSNVGVYTPDGNKVFDVTVHEKPLCSMALHPDNTHVAIGLTTGGKKVYSLPNFKCVGKVEGEGKGGHDMPASSIAFMGENTCVSGAGDYSINFAESRSSSGGGSWCCLVLTFLIVVLILFLVMRLGTKAASLPAATGRGEL